MKKNRNENRNRKELVCLREVITEWNKIQIAFKQKKKKEKKNLLKTKKENRHTQTQTQNPTRLFGK